jgi:hypothetical protein
MGAIAQMGDLERLQQSAGDPEGWGFYGDLDVRHGDGPAFQQLPPANSLTIFSGLAEEIYRLKFQQYISGASTNESQFIGIGYNSVLAMSGLQGRRQIDATGLTATLQQTAEYIAPPALGIQTISCLELGVTGTATYRGAETNMMLSAEWRA